MPPVLSRSGVFSTAARLRKNDRDLLVVAASVAIEYAHRAAVSARSTTNTHGQIASVTHTSESASQPPLKSQSGGGGPM